jgi:hypothetical protein
VPRNRRSHSSITSQRISSGERFQRSQRRQITHSRPLEASNAILRPTGKISRTSLDPSGRLQKMHVEYISMVVLRRGTI